VRNNSTWAPSALSPILWPDEAWNPWLVVLAAIATLVINVIPSNAYLLAYVLYARAHHIPLPDDLTHISAIQVLIAQVVSYVPLVAFLLAVLPRISHVRLAELGIRRPTMRDLLIGIVGTFAMLIAVILSSSAIAAITHRHDLETAVGMLKDLKNPFELGLFALVACVFAPIVEELTFRVLIFNALTKYAPLAVAAVFSGILFGAEHVILTPAAQLITVALPLALGGIVLAYVYSISGCFWSNVTTHACFNGINVVALVFFHAT